MRTLPRSTRVALAMLYIRMRDARRREARVSTTMGPDSPAATQARGASNEAWNALQSVQAAIRDDLRFANAATFRDYLTRRGKVLSRV